MSFDYSSLITDRTQADVERVRTLSAKGWASMTDEERAEWAAGMKGAYNVTDLNRVESAVEYLAGLLVDLPDEIKQYAADMAVAWDKFFDVPYDAEKYGQMNTKTDWAMPDLPSLSDMGRYLGNVGLVRDALTADYPDLVDTMENLTHTRANDIEQILCVAYAAYVAKRAKMLSQVDNTKAAFYYSGEIFGGEV